MADVRELMASFCAAVAGICAIVGDLEHVVAALLFAIYWKLDIIADRLAGRGKDRV